MIALAGGGGLVTCAPDATADHVIELFLEEQVGAVLVVTDDGVLAGFISTVDVLSAARGKL